MGVTIANDFSWDLHIYTKAPQRLYFIKHVIFDAFIKMKRVAYLTLCRPLLEYACEVWDLFLVKQVKFLDNVQKRAVRFIAGLKGRETISGTREILWLEVLELWRKNFRMALIVEIFSKEISSTLAGNSEFLQDKMHQYKTRLAAKNAPPAICSNKSFYQNIFMLRTSRNLRGRLWNFISIF